MTDVRSVSYKNNIHPGIQITHQHSHTVHNIHVHVPVVVDCLIEAYSPVFA